MKTFKRTIAIILMCLMVGSCYSANAESCYVALRELMNSKDQVDWYLGKGKSTSAEASKEIYAVYVENDEAFYIVGMNEYGKGEITIWNNIEALRGYHMIYSLCYIWDVLQENIDKGYSITIAITDMEMVEGDWVIDDAGSAADFVQVMEMTFASMSEN